MNLYGIARFACDPELVQTKSSQVCKFRLVFNEVVKSKASGEKKEIPSFLSFEAWDKGGELINKYFKKGDKIFVKSSSPRQDTWKTEDGQNRERIYFRLNDFEFVGGNKKETTNEVKVENTKDAEEATPF